MCIRDRGETEEAGRSYIQEKGYTFPVYFDRDLSAVMTYGITSIPTSFFIDSEGYIVSGYRGMMDESIVTRLLNSICLLYTSPCGTHCAGLS